MKEPTEREHVVNFLKYGDAGSAVWMDENNRCAYRASANDDTLPLCRLYEDWNDETEKGTYIGDALLYDAVRFLYNEEYEMC